MKTEWKVVVQRGPIISMKIHIAGQRKSFYLAREYLERIGNVYLATSQNVGASLCRISKNYTTFSTDHK